MILYMLLFVSNQYKYNRIDGVGSNPTSSTFYAVVAELVKAIVLKTVCGNTLVGSNPIYCAKL